MVNKTGTNLRYVISLGSSYILSEDQRDNCKHCCYEWRKINGYREDCIVPDNVYADFLRTLDTEDIILGDISLEAQIVNKSGSMLHCVKAGDEQYVLLPEQYERLGIYCEECNTAKGRENTLKLDEDVRAFLDTLVTK